MFLRPCQGMKSIKVAAFENGYIGGKEAAGTYQKIINEIRPFDVLIIPFLGHCAITRNIDWKQLLKIEELNQKVERLRMIKEAKMKYLRDHSRLLDQAFEELKEVTEGELDVICDKIQELDKRIDINQLSKD